MDETTRTLPRRRALRAAHAVTVTIAFAGPGCYGSHGVGIPEEDPPDDELARDAAAAEDSGLDAAPEATECGEPDWGAPGFDYSAWYERCCTGGERDPVGCTPWGPFVPPSEVA